MAKSVESKNLTTENISKIAGEMALQFVADGLKSGKLDVRTVGYNIHTDSLAIAGRSRLPVDRLEIARKIQTGVIVEIVKRMEGTK